MSKRILIILGHPSRERHSFCEALAEAYAEGAREAGHEVERIHIAALTFDPILHEGYQGQQAPESAIADAREKIRRAEHLVFVYPLWMFMIPALLKGFLERTFTEGFAYTMKARNPLRCGLLHGKSVRLMQTSGMPGFFYRLWFRAHGAKSLRDMLQFAGITPVRITCFGMIENGDARRKSYLNEAKALGRKGV